MMLTGLLSSSSSARERSDSSDDHESSVAICTNAVTDVWEKEFWRLFSRNSRLMTTAPKEGAADVMPRDNNNAQRKRRLMRTPVQELNPQPTDLLMMAG
jgi:hypothetical protein